MKKNPFLRFSWIQIMTICSICFLLFKCEQRSSSAEKASPNVIIIFPDQFRNYSLGIWSQPGYSQYIPGTPDPVSTPALDKLASESIVFNRAVSNFPVCSPYRAMLLSGLYPDHNGVTTNCRNDRVVSLRTDATCVTDVFAEAGYNVSYFGKAHWLKNEPLFDENGTYQGTSEPPGGKFINSYDTYVPPGPDRHSIEYMVQMIKDDHFNPMVYSSDPKVVDGKKDGERYMPGEFSSAFEAEKIMDYLDNTHGQRDTKKPFFMIWSLNPPHNPWTEKSTKMEYFDQYTEKGEVNLTRLLKRTNAVDSMGDHAPYYFANVSAVDFYIGQVLQKLEEMGEADNTIIVISSDHGEMLGSHGRQGKNVLESESLNIPFIIRWREKVDHRVDDLMMSVPDVMPTLLSLAGLEKMIPAEVQGLNHAGVLLDPGKADKPAEVLIMISAARGVFTGNYTFVVSEKDGKFDEAYYYDNSNDPYQLTRIPYTEMHPDLQKDLKQRLVNQLIRTNDRWYQEQIAAEFLGY